MRSETSKAVATAAPNMTPQEFAHFGDGSLAYVKTIASEDVARLFPQAPEMRPGLTLFALLGADWGWLVPFFILAWACWTVSCSLFQVLLSFRTVTLGDGFALCVVNEESY